MILAVVSCIFGIGRVAATTVAVMTVRTLDRNNEATVEFDQPDSIERESNTDKTGMVGWSPDGEARLEREEGVEPARIHSLRKAEVCARTVAHAGHDRLHGIELNTNSFTWCCTPRTVTRTLLEVGNNESTTRSKSKESCWVAGKGDTASKFTIFTAF